MTIKVNALFSFELEIESERGSGNMSAVCDVAALPDDDVAVAGSYGLFLIDHEGKCTV